MSDEIKKFVEEQCRQLEQRLSARLEKKMDWIGQLIENTIAKKEDVQRLQKQIDELKRT